MMLTADKLRQFCLPRLTVCFVVVELPVVIVSLAYVRLVAPHYSPNIAATSMSSISGPGLVIAND